MKRWAVLAASCAVLFLSGAVYSFSVLRDPLAHAKGFSLGTVVLAYSVNAGLAPLPMTVGGWLADRGAARWLAGIGGTMFGLGWIIAGWAPNPVTLVLGYGVVAGLGQGLAYAGCLHNNMRLFPDRRGLVAGLSISSNGASSVVVAPLARKLIDTSGVEQTMMLLGTAFIVVAVLAWLVIRPAPAPGDPARGGGLVAADGYTWRQMVTAWAFVPTFLIFICGAFTGVMMGANASPIGVAMYGLSASTGALFVSLFAASKMTGGAAFGAVTDWLGPVRTIMMVFATIAVSLVVLILTRGNAWGFAVGLIGLGLCFGGVMGVMPSIVAGIFGPRNQGLNYGTVFVGYSIAALFAPHLAANIGERSGNYTPAFLIALAAAGSGLLLAFALPNPNAARTDNEHETPGPYRGQENGQLRSVAQGSIDGG